MYSSPAVANGVVYISPAYDNNLYALNAKTGAKLWRHTTGGAVGSSPAVANGVVYVGTNGGMYAFSLK
jgi:outer membrane protein assembly factor BamB